MTSAMKPIEGFMKLDYVKGVIRRVSFIVRTREGKNICGGKKPVRC
ncbi:hypothetical protein GCM10023310_50840 [Paenibacillus vulneris]